jgi:hypothetical protein
MSNGRPTLPILAIILAISGITLGAFTFISVSRIETQVANFSDQNSWYKFNGTNFNNDPVYTYLIFEGLIVEFEVGIGESVYFSFTCRAHIEIVLGAWSYISVFFRVDELIATSPNAQVGVYNAPSIFTVHEMVHLQDVRYNLIPGTHNVTVAIYGFSTANYIWESSLFVQIVQN